MKWLVYFSIAAVAAAVGTIVAAAMYRIGVEEGKAQIMANINEVVAEECRKAGL